MKSDSNSILGQKVTVDIDNISFFPSARIIIKATYFLVIKYGMTFRLQNSFLLSMQEENCHKRL